MTECESAAGAGQPPFEIALPRQWRAPIIFNSPHSGADYPAEFLSASRIDLAALRRSEDSYVDEMIDGLTALGFPVVRVHFPRSYVDVNREPYELDPRMFDGRLPSFVNTRSMRVAGGLGTIPRVAGDGQEIYRDRLAVEEGLARIERLYKPYHRALRQLIAGARDQFGTVLLIDCHSMPSVGLSRDEPARADVVIGDRYGISCSPLLSRAAESVFAGQGYSTARNRPYAGGFITEHYGRPARNLHALQIEVNRGLYMDEKTFRKSAGFDALADDLARFSADLMAAPDHLFLDPPLAAE